MINHKKLWLILFVFIMLKFFKNQEKSLAGFLTKKEFSHSKQLASLSIRGLENEPKEPIINTAVPGPKSKELSSELSKIQVLFNI